MTKDNIVKLFDVLRRVTEQNKTKRRELEKQGRAPRRCTARTCYGRCHCGTPIADHNGLAGCSSPREMEPAADAPTGDGEREEGEG